MTPTGASEPSERASRDGGGRQTWSLVVAAVLGVVVVVAVLLVTLSAGRSDDSADGTGGNPASSTTPEQAFEQLAPVDIPPGDYRELCAELAKQATGLTGEVTPEQVKAVYGKLDFEPLIAVAPEGLVPALEQVRDEREAVLTVIDQVDDPSQIQSADLPEGFMESFMIVATATTQRCAAGGGA